MPMAVPRSEAVMVCEPALAVTSPRLLWRTKESWMAARDADAESHATFLPTLATPAMGTKYAGASGVISSNAVDKSSARLDAMRHLRGLSSKRVCTAAANAIPPSCPSPSLMTQFSAADMGAAAAEPTPTACGAERKA